MLPRKLFTPRTPKQRPSLRESIDMLFSNSWPYQSISPFQAYLIGVFGCLSVFGAYIFVSFHVSGRMRRKKRSGKTKKARMTIDRLDRESRRVICERRAISNDTDCYQRPHSAPNKIEFSSATNKPEATRALQQSYQDANVQAVEGTASLKVNISSYQLYEHMNSFPLETDGQCIDGENELNSFVPSASLPENRSSTSNQKEEVATVPKSHVVVDCYKQNKMNANQVHFDVQTTHCSLSEVGTCEVRVEQTLLNVEPIDAKKTAPEDKLDQVLLEPQTTSDSLPDGKKSEAMPILSVTNTSNEKKSCQVITTNDLASLSFESLSSCSKLICNEGFTMETASRAPAAQSKQHCSVEEADKEKSATATQYVNLSQDLSSKTVTMDLVTSSASISSISDDTASDIKEQNTADSPRIVVLVSTGVSDRTKATATLNLLSDLDLPYEVIDGRDPLQYEKRDKLFKISGSCNYPQIFISERGTCRYLGDYGQLEASVNEWTNACGMKYESKLPTLVHEQSSNGNDPSAFYNGHLTLLVSNGVVDYIQASNQKAAMQLLTDFSIPYKIVDGMDPSQLDKRNELFKISRIRGNYPQLFVVDESGGQHRYLGSYDWLDGQSANDLASILGGAVARSAD